MNELLLKTYIIISVLIALADILLSIISIQKNKTTGRYLGFACAVAAVVDISYLISILNDSYLCMSIMSSIYFASIDIMLVCLLVFTVYFTKNDFTKHLKILTLSLRLSFLPSIPSLRLPSDIFQEIPLSPDTATRCGLFTGCISSSAMPL